MRVLAVIALVVLICSALVSAGSPTFSVCSGAGALLEGVTITSAESSWQPSSTVTFTVTGTLKEELSAGTIDTYATFDGIEVANKQDPICTYEGTPFSCPEAPGAKSWTFPFEIPSVPWSGTLSSKSTFKSGSGAELFCMELSVGL